MGPRVHFGGGLVLGTLSGRARQRPLAKDSTRGGAAPSTNKEAAEKLAKAKAKIQKKIEK